MGDQEFEDFIDKNSEEELPYCQKRLLLDVIRLKLSTISNQLSGYLQSNETRVIFKEQIDNLIKLSEEGMEQLDYLMSTIIEEIDDENDPTDGTSI